ncbi:MAG TPA: hypothetical protein VE758_01115 [Chthoniobacterales bacterium]|nr:hypothetical protein [Chthoniobacterales bacterium]
MLEYWSIAALPGGSENITPITPSLGYIRCRDQSVKARFATTGSVAMDDAALRRLVDRRNELTNLIRRRLRGGTGAALQRAQFGAYAAITKSASGALPGAFSCRSCVRHP